MTSKCSTTGVTQALFPLNAHTVSLLVKNTPTATAVANVQIKKVPHNIGLNVTIKMASGSKSGRQGSPLCQTIPHTRIEDESHMNEYYDTGEKLGEGTFGIVNAVIYKETGQKWACKAVNKEKAGTPAIKLLEREVAILKRVRHDHIITLKEIFETSKKMYLVMEYCGGGELNDVLKVRKTFKEEQARIIVERLAKAISYLHRNDMVHRDLKLENILLSTNPRDHKDDLYIKVTDFGLSVVKSGVGIENLLMDFCGTPMYMAPEIIDNKTYGEKCDVWAMGVICYTLLCGIPPFQARDEDKLYELIKNHDIKTHMEQDFKWKDKSEAVRDFITRMLTIDPAHRYTSHETLDHPWITGKPLDTMRKGNVLDMMRTWRTEQEFKNIPNDVDENDSGAINGEVKETSSRDSSANSGSKESSKEQRKSLPGCSKKPLSHNLSKSTGRKSKSPNAVGSNTSTATLRPAQNSNYRLQPTKTANGNISRVTSDTRLRGRRK